MVTFFINNIKYSLLKKSQFTILQACEYLGYSIPYFCYSNDLISSGTCRLCLVELKTSQKPIVACITLLVEGMFIYLKSPIIQKIRENILEFLLLNHPLDCPVCDQGGECDLQDQSLKFGSERGRLVSTRTQGSDKFFSPLIQSIMVRCIVCSKCVRFSNMFLSTLGLVGRGRALEVGCYTKHNNCTSSISGNLIDLCPVGVFMSTDTSFRYRTWELKSGTTFDFFDVFGVSINLFFKRNEILRLLPVKMLGVKIDWISDRSRFSYDSFKFQRLYFPLIKYKNQFLKKSWFNLLGILKILLLCGPVTGFIGEHADLETIFLFKKFLSNLGSSSMFLDEGYRPKLVVQDFRKNYLVSQQLVSTITSLLVINLNCKIEESTLNLFLKEKFYNNFKFSIFNIGKPLNLLYPCTNIGWNFGFILNLLEGKLQLARSFTNTKTSLVFSVLNLQSSLNVVLFHSSFSTLNSFDIGITQHESVKAAVVRSKILFFINAHKFFFSKGALKKSCIFVGFQGGAQISSMNVILPSVSMVEKSFKMLSIFGRILYFSRILCLKYKQKVDLQIFVVLNRIFNNTSYLTLGFLSENPVFNFNFFPYISYFKTKQILLLNSFQTSKLGTFLGINFFKQSRNIIQYEKYITDKRRREAYNKLER